MHIVDIGGDVGFIEKPVPIPIDPGALPVRIRLQAKVIRVALQEVKLVYWGHHALAKVPIVNLLGELSVRVADGISNSRASHIRIAIAHHAWVEGAAGRRRRWPVACMVEVQLVPELVNELLPIPIEMAIVAVDFAYVGSVVLGECGVYDSSDFHWRVLTVEVGHRLVMLAKRVRRLIQNVEVDPKFSVWVHDREGSVILDGCVHLFPEMLFIDIVEPLQLEKNVSVPDVTPDCGQVQSGWFDLAALPTVGKSIVGRAVKPLVGIRSVE